MATADSLPVFIGDSLPFKYPVGPYIQRIQDNVTLQLYLDEFGRPVPESTRIHEHATVAAFEKLDRECRVFVAHDLAVVKNISDRVAVMYLGRLCEVGDPDIMYARPAHPYTAALLSAIPVPDPAVRPDQRTTLGGEIPSPLSPPSGCRFRTRCPKADEQCVQEVPVMTKVADDHFVACHHPMEPGEVLTTVTPVAVAGASA